MQAPSKEQLRELIAQTEDNLTCFIYLDREGIFHIMDVEFYDRTKHDFVVRSHSLVKGHGDLGQEAANDEIHINSIFLPLIDCWLAFLHNGNMNMFPGAENYLAIDEDAVMLGIKELLERL